PFPRRDQYAQGAHAFGYRRPIYAAFLWHPGRAASSGRRAKLPGSCGHWMPVGTPRVPTATEQRRRGSLLLESQSSLATPELQTCQGEIPIPRIETAAQFAPPANSWTMLAGVVRPK